MNTLSKTFPARSSAFVVGLVLLLGSLPGCYIDAKIGDDPESDGAATSSDEEATTDPTAGPGATSGQPGTASMTSTASTSAGEDTGPAATAGEDTLAPTGGGVDPETALALCGVVVVPPGPGDRVYHEGILCSGGCAVDIETSVPVGLYDYGECLCDVMFCGDMVGGTTGSTFGDSDTDTTGDPDGCGPFPAGEGEFTCSCEMCSIDVTSVDATWIDDEADLPTICECMCGGAGCGSPV